MTATAVSTPVSAPRVHASRRPPRQRFGGMALGVLTWLIVLLFFFPVLWMALTGFKQESDAATDPPRVLFSPTLKQYAAAFAKLLPHLDKQELYWRLDIVSGALTYAMADFGLIKRRGATPQQHRELAAAHLIKFAASGLRTT